MHAYLPTWLRGSFELRRDGSAVALVRRDFASSFDRLGLLRHAGLSPERRRFPSRTAELAGERPAAEPVPGRGAVRIVAAEELGEAIVRPCRRGGLPGRILRRRYLLGNRAFDELVVTEALRWRGVPVAEPLAAVQERRRPGYVALLVTRRLPGALPLSRLLEASGSDGTTPLMRAAGRTVRLLHGAGGWHADLNAGNLVADPGDPELRVSVLDLDRGRLFPAPLPSPLTRRNLRRLRRSLSKLGLDHALAAWPAFEEGYEAWKG